MILLPFLRTFEDYFTAGAVVVAIFFTSDSASALGAIDESGWTKLCRASEGSIALDAEVVVDTPTKCQGFVSGFPDSLEDRDFREVALLPVVEEVFPLLEFECTKASAFRELVLVSD